jgi:hypothetical protein
LMQRDHPDALPRIRAEMHEATAGHGDRGPLEARIAGRRTDTGQAEVNNDTGLTSLTAPTGGMLPPSEPPR